MSELKRKILAAVNLADYNLAGELNAELVAVVEQQQAQNPAAEAHAAADDAAAAHFWNRQYSTVLSCPVNAES